MINICHEWIMGIVIGYILINIILNKINTYESRRLLNRIDSNGYFLTAAYIVLFFIAICQLLRM